MGFQLNLDFKRSPRCLRALNPLIMAGGILPQNAA